MAESESPQELLLEHPLPQQDEVPQAPLLKDLLPRPSEEDEQALASQVISDHLGAITDRSDWEHNLAIWEDQYLGNLPEKTFPYVNCSNFHVPLTMLGVETLKPRLVESILSGDPPIQAIPTESSDEERRDRVELFLNWQLLSKSQVNILPLVEISAHQFLTPGMTIAKVFWHKDQRKTKRVAEFPPQTPVEEIFRSLFGPDLPKEWTNTKALEWEGYFQDPDGARRDIRVKFLFTDDAIHALVERDEILRQGPQVDLLTPEDFVVPVNGGGDVQRLPWCHQVLRYTEQDLRRKVKQGRFYRDRVEELIGAGGEGAEQTEGNTQQVQTVRATSEGTSLDGTSDVRQDEWEVIESYRRWDLDDDGWDEEIIVWVPLSMPNKILGWDYLDNVLAHGKRPYVVGRYLALPDRFYGLSFPQIVQGIQEEINAIHNQRVDFGTIRNAPGGFYRASMSFPPNGAITPGHFTPVDNPQQDIMIPNWNGSDAWGLNEESLLWQAFERLSGVTDLSLGRQPNRVGATRTASGTAALLSEAGLRYKNSMLAFQRFWAEVSDHILALDQQYLPSGIEFRVTGRSPEIIKVTDRSQIAGQYDLRLSATTETLNKQVQREDATIKLNTALNPIILQTGRVSMKGLDRLLRQFFRAYGEDPDMILEPMGEQLAHTPDQDLQIWSSGGTVDPSPLENQQQHIDHHGTLLGDPSPAIAAIRQQLGPQKLQEIQQHLAKHLQMAQVQAMAMAAQSRGPKAQSPVAGEQAQNAQTGRMAGMVPMGANSMGGVPA